MAPWHFQKQSKRSTANPPSSNQSDATNKDKSAASPTISLRGTYGDGSKYEKMVKLDVGWRHGPDGPFFDDRRHEWDNHEAWSKDTLGAVMDVPSGWDHERKLRDERDEKRRAGLIKSTYTPSGRVWEDESEYHFISFKRKRDETREVWEYGISDKGIRGLQGIRGAGLHGIAGIPRPHTLFNFNYNEDDLHILGFSGQQGSHTPSPDSSSYDVSSRLCQLCSHIPLDRLLRSSSEKYSIPRALITADNTTSSCVLSNGLVSLDQSHNDASKEKKLDHVDLFIKFQDLIGVLSPVRSPFLLVPAVNVVAPLQNPPFSSKLSLFPEAGSKLHFRLLNEWIRACNDTHSHDRPVIEVLPKRVIDVGWHENSTKVWLRDTKFTTGVYIALSHRWGRHYDKIKTTKANITDRMTDIPIETLPQTFQDAITVTRGLRIQFLWIDTLCIVQDDPKDVRFEIQRMESTFAYAYFTIAATSATEGDGFLHRPDDNFHRLGNANAYGYVNKQKADFRRDVELGGLNQRGWVLQERALSCRIIHFTSAQTYWECGSAIWCESNERIDYRSPLGSSKFPDRGSHKQKWTILTDIFQQYSRLGLSQATDRPLAIAGIVDRLETAYNTSTVHGIVRDSFGQSLLWMWSEGEQPLEPIINFDTDFNLWIVGRQKVPTWSWMAYKGPIAYLEPPNASLIWESDFKFVYEKESRCIIYAPLMQATPHCRLERDQSLPHLDLRVEQESPVLRYQIIENEIPSGWIQYDYLDADTNKPLIENMGFILIAWSEEYCEGKGKSPMQNDRGRKCYTILVEKVSGKVYRRRGIAILDDQALFQRYREVSII